MGRGVSEGMTAHTSLLPDIVSAPLTHAVKHWPALLYHISTTSVLRIYIGLVPFHCFCYWNVDKPGFIVIYMLSFARLLMRCCCSLLLIDLKFERLFSFFFFYVASVQRKVVLFSIDFQLGWLSLSNNDKYASFLVEELVDQGQNQSSSKM